MTLKKLFGKNLKLIREDKGLTQQELAEMLDMQTNSIGLIEIGQRAASFTTIEKIAEKLNINYSDLFDFNFGVDKSKEKLVSDLNKEIVDFDKKILKHLVEYSRMLKPLFKKK